MCCNRRHRNLKVVLCGLVLIAAFSAQASAQSPPDARSARVSSEPASACSGHMPKRTCGSDQRRCGPACVPERGHAKPLLHAQRATGAAGAAALRHWRPEYLEDRHLRVRGERSTKPSRTGELQPARQQRRLAWSRRAVFLAPGGPGYPGGPGGPAWAIIHESGWIHRDAAVSTAGSRRTPESPGDGSTLPAGLR